jgi:hypothetical protein
MHVGGHVKQNGARIANMGVDWPKPGPEQGCRQQGTYSADEALESQLPVWNPPTPLLVLFDL